ncbi:MAG TPA: ATP-binding cassette domain-containing protein [Pseudonocardiaceae bacterium]|jgi:ABC-type multidrug transport system ATPase subunit|nr:ATP-binding cassette domain-containing protein [Pseudonocardiaceae bacterium]
MSEPTSTDTAELTEVDGPAPEPAEPPLLLAEGLGLRGGRGWVYRDVTLRVPPGGLAAVSGPAGSGRSMLLLTLAGRAKPTEGSVRVAEQGGAKAIRGQVAVARITGAAELEPDLRVRDHVHELRALLGKDVDFATARAAVGLEARGEAMVADLDVVQSTLLSLALAVAGDPRVLVLDDLDRHTTPEQADALWETLRQIAELDIAVIASCTDPRPATEHGATVLTLPVPNRPDDETPEEQR